MWCASSLLTLFAFSAILERSRFGSFLSQLPVYFYHITSVCLQLLKPVESSTLLRPDKP